MNGPLVLVVDDQLVNLRLMRTLLEAEGYEVTTARDADEAGEALRARRPALVLMDLQMPGMDGLELTRRLRADPATRDLPIVAVTSFAMVGDEEKALEAGCDEYVTKPIDTRTFPSLVARFAGPPGCSAAAPR